MTELLFFMLKQNRKKNSLLLTEKYTVALIGINLYVLFLYLFIQLIECSAKYTYCTWT